MVKKIWFAKEEVARWCKRFHFGMRLLRVLRKLCIWCMIRMNGEHLLEGDERCREVVRRSCLAEPDDRREDLGVRT